MLLPTRDAAHLSISRVAAEDLDQQFSTFVSRPVFATVIVFLFSFNLP
jgi:hypothetical protein